MTFTFWWQNKKKVKKVITPHEHWAMTLRDWRKTFRWEKHWEDWWENFLFNSFPDKEDEDRPLNRFPMKDVWRLGSIKRWFVRGLPEQHIQLEFWQKEVLNRKQRFLDAPKKLFLHDYVWEIPDFFYEDYYDVLVADSFLYDEPKWLNSPSVLFNEPNPELPEDLFGAYSTQIFLGDDTDLFSRLKHLKKKVRRINRKKHPMKIHRKLLRLEGSWTVEEEAYTLPGLLHTRKALVGRQNFAIDFLEDNRLLDSLIKFSQTPTNKLPSQGIIPWHLNLVFPIKYEPLSYAHWPYGLTYRLTVKKLPFTHREDFMRNIVDFSNISAFKQEKHYLNWHRDYDAALENLPFYLPREDLLLEKIRVNTAFSNSRHFTPYWHDANGIVKINSNTLPYLSTDHRRKFGYESSSELLERLNMINQPKDASPLIGPLRTGILSRTEFNLEFDKTSYSRTDQNIINLITNDICRVPGTKLWSQLWAPLSIYTPFRDFSQNVTALKPVRIPQNTPLWAHPLTEFDDYDTRNEEMGVGPKVVPFYFLSTRTLKHRSQGETNLVFIDPLFHRERTEDTGFFSYEGATLTQCCMLVMGSLLYIFTLFRLQLLLLWFLKYLDERDFFLFRKLLGINIFPYLKKIAAITERLLFYMLVLGFLYCAMKYPFFFYIRWPSSITPIPRYAPFTFNGPMGGPLSRIAPYFRGFRLIEEHERDDYRLRYKEKRMRKWLYLFKHRYYGNDHRPKGFKREENAHVVNMFNMHWGLRTKLNRKLGKSNPFGLWWDDRPLNHMKRFVSEVYGDVGLLLKRAQYSYPIYNWIPHREAIHGETFFATYARNFTVYSRRRAKRFKQVSKYNFIQERNYAKSFLKTREIRNQLLLRNLPSAVSKLPRYERNDPWRAASGSIRFRIKQSRLFTPTPSRIGPANYNRRGLEEVKPSWGFSNTLWHATKVMLSRYLAKLYFFPRYRTDSLASLKDFLGFKFIRLAYDQHNLWYQKLIFRPKKRSFYYHHFPILPSFLSTIVSSFISVITWHIYHIITILTLAALVFTFHPNLQRMPSASVIGRTKYATWLNKQFLEEKKIVFEVESMDFLKGDWTDEFISLMWPERDFILYFRFRKLDRVFCFIDGIGKNATVLSETSQSKTDKERLDKAFPKMAIWRRYDPKMFVPLYNAYDAANELYFRVVLGIKRKSATWHRVISKYKYVRIITNKVKQHKKAKFEWQIEKRPYFYPTASERKVERILEEKKRELQRLRDRKTLRENLLREKRHEAYLKKKRRIEKEKAEKRRSEWLKGHLLRLEQEKKWKERERNLNEK